MIRRRRYSAVVIGVSAGGLDALKLLLGRLPADFPMPVLVVQHIDPATGDRLARLLEETCAIRVKEADEQEAIQPGTVYLAPANYHLLLESNLTLSLSTDPPVNHARPSVDVLFESAADALGPRLIGVILTGGNADGSSGIKKIKETGGVVIIQDPGDAEVKGMPQAALEMVEPDFLLSLVNVADVLTELGQKMRSANAAR